MLTLTKRDPVRQYLDEKLQALVPVYTENDRTIVLTAAGEHREPRTLPRLVEKIAACYCIDLSELRRQCRELLGIKRYFPLPLCSDLVLLPVMLRQAELTGELTFGFVNLAQVESLKALPELAQPRLSKVIFHGGSELETYNSKSTLLDKKDHGETARKAFTHCFESSAPNPRGMTREALIKMLPTCECLLRDMFIDFAKLKL